MLRKILVVGVLVGVALTWGGVSYMNRARVMKPELTVEMLLARHSGAASRWMVPRQEATPNTQTILLGDGTQVSLEWVGRREVGSGDSEEPGKESLWMGYDPVTGSPLEGFGDSAPVKFEEEAGEKRWRDQGFPGVMARVVAVGKDGAPVQVARAKLFDVSSLTDLGNRFGVEYDGVSSPHYDWFRTEQSGVPQGMGEKTFVFPSLPYAGGHILVVDVVHGEEEEQGRVGLDADGAGKCETAMVGIELGAVSLSEGKAGEPDREIRVVKTKAGSSLEFGLSPAGRAFSGRLWRSGEETLVFDGEVRPGGSSILFYPSSGEPADEVSVHYRGEVSRVVFRIPPLGEDRTWQGDLFDMPMPMSLSSSNWGVYAEKLMGVSVVSSRGWESGNITASTLGEYYEGWVESVEEGEQFQVLWDREMLEVKVVKRKTLSEYFVEWRRKVLGWF